LCQVAVATRHPPPARTDRGERHPSTGASDICLQAQARRETRIFFSMVREKSRYLIFKVGFARTEGARKRMRATGEAAALPSEALVESTFMDKLAHYYGDLGVALAGRARVFLLNKKTVLVLRVKRQAEDDAARVIDAMHDVGDEHAATFQRKHVAGSLAQVKRALKKLALVSNPAELDLLGT
jgi:RNase P/RNase MRP subunit POP5